MKHITIIIAGLCGAVTLALAFVIVVPMLPPDDPFIEFLVKVVMATAGLVALGNVAIHSHDYWTRHRKTRARKRARALLLRLLTPAQQEQYLKGLPITVPVRVGGKEHGYAQIGGGISGVVWYPNPRSRRQWLLSGRQCIMVSTPEDIAEDDLVALLLWLRTDPRGLIEMSYPQRYSVYDAYYYGEALQGAAEPPR